MLTRFSRKQEFGFGDDEEEEEERRAVSTIFILFPGKKGGRRTMMMMRIEIVVSKEEEEEEEEAYFVCVENVSQLQSRKAKTSHVRSQKMLPLLVACKAKS